MGERIHLDLSEEVPNYPITLYLTEQGYVYKFRGQQEPNLKPGDKVSKTFETDNRSEILVFGTDRICYKVHSKDIEETRATSLGTYLPALIDNRSVQISSYSILDEKYKFILAVYSNNRISKINLEAFLGNRKFLKNSYNLKQDLVDMVTLETDTTITMVTDKVKVDSSTLSLTGSRGATGVYITRKGITQKVEVA
ncbi:hypothetical protein [Sporosarcina sp. FSL K6-1508]|uniref:hypothetical protein n=1 Tax=Sporosarcina sp. FSL K6-1508 TaxID=2921553 RepID=UPI0030F88CB2